MIDVSQHHDYTNAFLRIVFNAVIECPALLTVGNETIVYSSDITEPYDYGTTATYQCNSGYELTGEDTVRTCTGDGSSPMGHWSGTASNCSGIII